jgi:hypothetical protein
MRESKGDVFLVGDFDGAIKFYTSHSIMWQRTSVIQEWRLWLRVKCWTLLPLLMGCQKFAYANLMSRPPSTASKNYKCLYFCINKTIFRLSAPNVQELHKNTTNTDIFISSCHEVTTAPVQVLFPIEYIWHRCTSQFTSINIYNIVN